MSSSSSSASGSECEFSYRQRAHAVGLVADHHPQRCSSILDIVTSSIPVIRATRRKKAIFQERVIRELPLALLSCFNIKARWRPPIYFLLLLFILCSFHSLFFLFFLFFLQVVILSLFKISQYWICFLSE